MIFEFMMIAVIMCAIVTAVWHVAKFINENHKMSEMRAEQGSRHSTASRIIEQHLAEAVALRFDRSCTFNGYISEGPSQQNGLHECIDQGSIRIWRIVEHTKSGDRIHFKAAHVRADGTMSDVIRYYPNNYSKVFSEGDEDFARDVPKFERMAERLTEAFPIRPTELEGNSNG